MLSRRELLERGAAIAGGAFALGRVPSAWATAPRPRVAGMNIVMFITDQEARSSISRAAGRGGIFRGSRVSSGMG